MSRLPWAHGLLPCVRLQVAAVDVLVARRREELGQAQAAARDLLAEMPAEERHRPEDIVEVLVGGRRSRPGSSRLLTGTREELAVFDRPPYVSDPERSDSSVPPCCATRCRARALRARGTRSCPARLEAAQDAVRVGERSRVHAGLPMKLAIGDRRLAILPVGETEVVDAALCVRPSRSSTRWCSSSSCCGRRPPIVVRRRRTASLRPSRACRPPRIRRQGRRGRATPRHEHPHPQPPGRRADGPPARPDPFPGRRTGGPPRLAARGGRSGLTTHRVMCSARMIVCRSSDSWVSAACRRSET